MPKAKKKLSDKRDAHLRLEDEDYVSLKRIADAENRSLAYVIVKLMRRGMQGYEPVSP